MNVNRKGKEFERAIVRQLNTSGKAAALRNLQFQRNHGHPDVSASIIGAHLWLECKSGRLNVAAIYVDTAKRSRLWHGVHRCAAVQPCTDPTLPAVVHKSSRTGPALITLSLADLLRLVRR